MKPHKKRTDLGVKYCMYVWMDGWMYVCMYGWMDGWIWSLPITAAASVILKKMALNEEENLAEIKREILKVIDYSGESAHLNPSADVNFNKNSEVST